MTMNVILLLIILRSLSSVLCLNCSDVRQSNELGVYVRRDRNGGRSYWVYDRNGSEWRFYLEERDGQMDINRFDDNIFSDDRRIVNRFSNYLAYGGNYAIYNCANNITSAINLIVCRVDYWNGIWRQKEETFSLDIEYSLVFKTYPEGNWNLEATYLMAYNRQNKSDRVRLRMFVFDGTVVNYGVYVEKDQIEDILFIKEMNDSLFSQIDSMVDYNWDHMRGLTGHMLWFNIDHKYYYCFQPEGKPLSEQCSAKEKMKMALKECFDRIEETTVETTEETTRGITKETITYYNTWLIISIVIILISIVIIAIIIIIGVIVLVNRSNNKVKPQSPKAKRGKSSIESQSSSKQSDSMDEDARKIVPGQKFHLLRLKSEVLEKEMLSPKK